MKRWVAVVVMCAGILVSNSFADIKNWQTGQTIPRTQNITPGPGISLAYWNTSSKNLKYADFSGGQDLSNSDFSSSWLDYAQFTGANLTNVNMSSSVLTGVNLADARVMGTNFYRAKLTGFAANQLYSTASYKIRT